MLQKIKNLVLKYKLNDVRNLGLLAFAAIVVAVSWNGAQAIQLNYNLQKRVAKIEQENQIVELQNATEKLRNEYYKTEQFQELEARRILGKAAPGEKVYVVTKEAALAHIKTPEPPVDTKDTKSPVQKTKAQKNFEDWLDFFFNRPFRNE